MTRLRPVSRSNCFDRRVLAPVVAAALVTPAAIIAAGDASANDPDPTPAASPADAEQIPMEADLPDGFPPAGPADQVVRKQLPAYRMAVTDREDRGDRAMFWRLFTHIQDRAIPMTAPVEMTLGPDGPETDAEAAARTGRPVRMGFLYPDTDTGSEGEAGGGVAVVDVPPMEVLSFGFFGDRDADRIAAAQATISAELADNSELAAFEAAGPFRLFGYHGPATPMASRFHEVQLPIRPVAAD